MVIGFLPTSVLAHVFGDPWFWDVLEIVKSAAVVGVIVALWSLLVQRQKNDFDTSHKLKEKAVDLLFRWTDMIQTGAGYAVKFANSLTYEQAVLLDSVEPFPIAPGQEEALDVAVLGDELEFATDGQGRKCVTEKQVVIIRSKLVAYTNTLEAIAHAWDANLADRDILEREFRYALGGKRKLLETYRVAAGGERAYPKLAAFESAIRNRFGGEEENGLSRPIDEVEGIRARLESQLKEGWTARLPDSEQEAGAGQDGR